MAQRNPDNRDKTLQQITDALGTEVLNPREKQELSDFAEDVAKFEDFPEEQIPETQDLLEQRHIEMSTTFPAYSSFIGGVYGCCAVMPFDFEARIFAHPGRGAGPQPIDPIGPMSSRFKYTESRFPAKVIKKAWQLLEQYMSTTKWAAFMGGRTVEIENSAKTHRLLINKGGHFTVLEGGVGEGINVLSGRITEDKYPLGDEISAFIDWFQVKTAELIASWGCGSFAIREKKPSPVIETVVDEFADIDENAVIMAARDLPQPIGFAVDGPDREGNVQVAVSGHVIPAVDPGYGHQGFTRKLIRRLKGRKEVR